MPLTDEQRQRVAQEVIESAFKLDARLHAAQLPELRGCEIEVDIHPAQKGDRTNPVQPWLTLVIEWPAAGTGPLKMTRQRVDGMRIAPLLDVDLVNVTEKELTEAALFGAPLQLTDAEAAQLCSHVRLNGQGGALMLDLVQKAAALCVMPTTAHATSLAIAADFAWEHRED